MISPFLPNRIPVHPPPKLGTVVSVARSDTRAGRARTARCAPLLPRPRRGLRSQVVAHDGGMVDLPGGAVKREMRKMRSCADAAQGAPRSRGWQRRCASARPRRPGVLQLCADRPRPRQAAERVGRDVHGQRCADAERCALSGAYVMPPQETRGSIATGHRVGRSQSLRTRCIFPVAQGIRNDDGSRTSNTSLYLR